MSRNGGLDEEKDIGSIILGTASKALHRGLGIGSIKSFFGALYTTNYQQMNEYRNF